KRAAAEAESKYFIVGRTVVPAYELVEIDDVAFESPPEAATQNGKRLERRCADAVVVAGDLLGAREIERLEHPPYVGAPHLRRGVPGAVGQQDDFLAHGCPSFAVSSAATLAAPELAHPPVAGAIGCCRRLIPMALWTDSPPRHGRACPGHPRL